MSVRTGNRQVLVWGENVWVTIVAGGKAGEYRVLPSTAAYERHSTFCALAGAGPPPLPVF